MTGKKSRFAPAEYPDLPPLAGIRMATAAAGIKYTGRNDLLLVAFDRDTQVTGVLTQSQCAAAPVDWCRARLPGNRARALVVNSGNANAFTGVKGMSATQMTADYAANALGCEPDQVYLASTGVIGEPLDPAPFSLHLNQLAAAARDDNYLDAAKAIMTTDTFPKVATRSATLAGRTVHLNGIAKGSGMIAPDMATMLAFIFTDAALPADALGPALSRSVETSFNAITVDGDTSTSDTVLLFATGAAGDSGPVPVGEDALADFSAALDSLCADLAGQIVRDGEGASKIVEIKVKGAVSVPSARAIGFSVANSPLVKTAIAGEDANWGRVVMAVGKAGEPADRDRLSIWFGPHRVAVDGERDPSYSESEVGAYMKQPELVITIDIGLGNNDFSVWTCDLTHQYIAINAEYRS